MGILVTPSSPKLRPRVFYGWYILAVILLTGLFAGPTSQAFIGILVEPVSDATGWSRTSIAGSVTVGGILAGVSAPFIGILADRYSPRVLMTAGALLMALSFFIIALAPTVWFLYAGYALARGLAQNLIAGVVPRVLVVNWFRRYRGRAIGLTGTAHPIGTFAMGPVALLLISAGFSWRTVWALFGVAVIAFIVLPNALVLRRTPEEMGLLPDGDVASSEEEAAEITQREMASSWTFRQAIRTPALTLILSSIVLTNYGGGGLPFHMPQYYEEQGFAAAIGVAAVSMFAISGAFANTLWGFLAERISERLLGVFTMVMGLALAAGFRYVSNETVAVGYGVLLGIAARGEGSILMLLVANYYGRRSYGVISGVVQTALLVGLALGPYFMSVLRERTGSYDAVFYSAMATFALAAVLLALARKPALPQEADAPTPAGGTRP